MLGVGVIIRKAKRFFSAFIPQQPNNSFHNTYKKDEKIVYDDGDVKVYKGDNN